MATETGIDANEIGMPSDSAQGGTDEGSRAEDSSSLDSSMLSSPDIRDLTPESDEGDEGSDDGQGAAEEKDGAGDQNKEAKADDGEEKPQEGQDGRYDKDPAWQRIIKQRDETREENIRLKAQLDVLAKQQEAAPVAPLPSDFKDLSQFSDDEIREWMEDDPKGFVANLTAKIHADIEMKTQQKEQQNALNQKVHATFSSYAEANPDFNDLWESGEIQKFMDENPGHNAISAHQMLTGEARVQARIDAAVKEATEKITANFRAKRNAEVLSGGPARQSSGGADVPVELTNTKKYGGRTSVLTSILQASRNALSP